MWFRNFVLFQCTEKFPLTEEDMLQKLKEHTFVQCAVSEPQSIGWVSPIGDSDSPLVHGNNGFLMVALKIQEKVIPSSIIKDMLDEKVDEIELKENRKVRKKEKDALKDDIYQSLLPRAFSKTSVIYAYIDTKDGWFIVNTPSNKKAELLTVELRKALGSLKIAIPELLPVSVLLTNWIKTNDYPKDLIIEDNCVMQDNHDGGGIIRCQKQNLLAEDIEKLIDSGREVIQLGLSWQDKVSFIVNDELVIKSLKFLELVQDQANDIYSETPKQKFDADFSIMTLILQEFISYLMSIFAKNPSSLTEEEKTDLPITSADSSSLDEFNSSDCQIELAQDESISEENSININLDTEPKVETEEIEKVAVTEFELPFDLDESVEISNED